MGGVPIFDAIRIVARLTGPLKRSSSDVALEGTAMPVPPPLDAHRIDDRRHAL
jgi:hypothetical protein